MKIGDITVTSTDFSVEDLQEMAKHANAACGYKAVASDVDVINASCWLDAFKPETFGTRWAPALFEKAREIYALRSDSFDFDKQARDMVKNWNGPCPEPRVIAAILRMADNNRKMAAGETNR